MGKRKFFLAIACGLCLFGLLCGCQNQTAPVSEEDTPLRDSTPTVRTPMADGLKQGKCKSAFVDYSHTDQGYFVANYSGDNHKVKLLLDGPDGVQYTYTLNGGDEVFPLTAGDGRYTVSICENIEGINYSVILSVAFDVTLQSEFLPFLYPNQYVMFGQDTDCVTIGSEQAAGAHSEIEVVSSVYNYVMKNLSYDYEKSKKLQSGYTPKVDEILDEGKGICFDYAAVMATMLRTQNIPTKLDVGYAGTIYHAWLSVYIKDLGWVNGIIEFDGVSWQLMDPTFADNDNQSKEIMKFISDKENYDTKYKY
ncbi:MAG: transglutaminase-like domain-containing protein [Oscillospiraceae bacterium]